MSFFRNADCKDSMTCA